MTTAVSAQSGETEPRQGPAPRRQPQMGEAIAPPTQQQAADSDDRAPAPRKQVRFTDWASI